MLGCLFALFDIVVFVFVLLRVVLLDLLAWGVLLWIDLDCLIVLLIVFMFWVYVAGLVLCDCLLYCVSEVCVCYIVFMLFI